MGASVRVAGPGKWIVRWRNQGDKNPTDRVFRGTSAGLKVRLAEIDRAIGEAGSYSWEAEERKVAPASNLLAGLEAFIGAKRARGKITAKTEATYTSYKLRVMGHIHAITRTPETSTLPVTVLSRDLFDRIAARDVDAGASAMMSYAAPLLLMKAWQWMAGDPLTWNHVPPAPQGEALDEYLPRTPSYKRTKAPTMAHLDACIRHMPPKATQSTRIAAIVMRYTGLRAAEVFGLRYEDFDAAGKLLHVRGTKTDAADRVLPLADALLAEPGVRGWFSLSTTGPAFPKRRHTTRKAADVSGRKVASQTFRLAWEAATAADEAPTHVWKPEGRRYSRPEHAFRAALQAHLRDQDVREDVIDYLVGHEGNLRDVHYGRDLDEKCRAALATIPPVDWHGPAALPGNVHALATARGR